MSGFTSFPAFPLHDYGIAQHMKDAAKAQMKMDGGMCTPAIAAASTTQAKNVAGVRKLSRFLLRSKSSVREAKKSTTEARAKCLSKKASSAFAEDNDRSGEKSIDMKIIEERLIRDVELARVEPLLYCGNEKDKGRRPFPVRLSHRASTSTSTSASASAPAGRIIGYAYGCTISPSCPTHGDCPTHGNASIGKKALRAPLPRDQWASSDQRSTKNRYMTKEAEAEWIAERAKRGGPSTHIEVFDMKTGELLWEAPRANTIDKDSAATSTEEKSNSTSAVDATTDEEEKRPVLRKNAKFDCYSDSPEPEDDDQDQDEEAPTPPQKAAPFECYRDSIDNETMATGMGMGMSLSRSNSCLDLASFGGAGMALMSAVGGGKENSARRRVRKWIAKPPVLDTIEE